MANDIKKGHQQYHIYSKHAVDVHYDEYEPGGADMPKLIRSVTIKGGAGVANKNLYTPMGIHTEIDSDDMESLNRNGVWQQHLKAGAVSVHTKNIEVEKAVADMASDPDPSSPLTPADYEDENYTGPVPMGIKRRGRPSKS